MAVHSALEAELFDILRAVHILGKRESDGWVTWNRVSKHLSGSEEEADRYAAVADLPQHGGYLALTRNRRSVKLTMEGLEFLKSMEAPEVVDPDTPAGVAEAIRRYASKLRNAHLRALNVVHVACVGGRQIQALQVEMGDGRFPTGTPVEYRPNGGGSRTRGTVVGQDPHSPCLYVATDTEIHAMDMPGVLSVDRGFLWAELASRIENLDDIPARVAPLIGEDETDGAGTDVQDSMQAAVELVIMPRPWTRLLWGPPGSGKTYAIAQFATDLVRADPEIRILLVAPSNLAADVLTEEVVAAMENAGEDGLIRERNVLRYGYPCEESILGRPELLGPTEAETLTERIAGAARRLAAAERKQATEASLAALRAEKLAAQSSLADAVQAHLQQSRVVISTVASAYSPRSPIADLAWPVVVIDEVTMVPPAVCYYLGSLAKEMFLLAGDPRQLGPVVEQERGLSEAESKWLGTDVFEASGAISGRNGQRRVSADHPLMIRITEQRRCKPRIWKQIEHLYPGVRCRRPRGGRRRTAGLAPLPSSAVVLADAGESGKSPCLPENGSWYNASTAELCVEMATSILGDEPKLDVAIITPFRAQAARLRRLVRAEQAACDAYQRIRVGTVHQFQGSAADVVIFDVVEDYKRDHLTRILQGDDGLRLVNVAISRAREKLIFVANQSWHRDRMKRRNNKLLWDLIVNRPSRETIRVREVRQGSSEDASRYELPYEALLGEAMKSVPCLRRVVAQHRICRGDGSLISRADFAVPELKYAVYVDGATWHLTRRGWQRDQRLRGELRENGWTISVFPASDVGGDCMSCIREIAEQVQKLASQDQQPRGRRRRRSAA